MKVDISEDEYRFIREWYYTYRGEGYSKDGDNKTILNLAKTFNDLTTQNYLEEWMLGR